MQSMGEGEGRILGEMETKRAHGAKPKRFSGGTAHCGKAKKARAAAQPEPKEATTEMGIDLVGRVPWGTHACLFYQSKDDLTDILVPYFKAGLDRNEFCTWITAGILNPDEAKEALGRAVGNLDDYLDGGQIELLDHKQFYTKSGMFDTEAVLRAWIEKGHFAEERGFEGFRISGDAFWLEQEKWQEFAQYEQLGDSVIARSRILAVCAYFLGRCGAAEIIDVVANHDFAVIRRKGHWDVVEKSTRRQQAEEALRQSEERFRLAMETSTDGIWDWNIAKDEVYRNDRHAKMLGYEPHELSASQDEWEKRIHPEDKPRVLQVTRDHLTGKSDSVEVEYRLKTKSGDYIWVLGRGKIVGYTDDGAPLRMIGTNIDITERKKAAEALRESEQKYRTLVEQAVMGVAIAQGNPPRLVFVNPAMAEITGYSVGELTSLSPEGFAGLIHPEDRTAFFGRLDDRFAGKELSSDWVFRAVRKDRQVRWLQLSCRRITYADQLAVQASLADVTDRIVAEQAVAESEERFRGIFENSMVGLYRTTPEGRILMANQAIVEMLGYTSFGELEKRNLEHEGFEPDYPRSEFRRRVEADGQVSGLESRWIRTDGTVLFVRESARVIRDEQANVTYYEGTVEDITKRKKAEQALRESEKRLALAIECAGLGLWDQDFEAGKISRNENWATMLGYEPDEIGCDRESYRRLLHPDDLPRFERCAGDHEGGLTDVFDIEHRMRDKSGQWRWIHNFGRIVNRDEHGRPLRALGVHLDVTERKKAEQVLRSRARLNRILLDAMPNVAMLIRPHTREVVACNERATQAGVRPGKRCFERSGKKGKPCSWCRAPAVWKTGRPQQSEVEVAGLVWDARWVPVSENLYMYYAYDITERKRAENDLKKERNYLESLHNALGDVVFTVLMPERIVKSVNETVESVLGYTPKECEGKRTEIFYPNRRAFLEFGKRLKRGIEEGKDVIKTEQILKRKNGEIFFSEMTTSFLTEDGRITEIISIVRDITDRKITEARLIENRMKLKAMASRILRAEDRERQRIAVGLHDDICQKLVLTKLALESALGSMSDTDASKLVETACGAIGEAIEDADSLTFALSNPVLRELGFEAALERYLSDEIRQKHGIEYEFERTEEPVTLPDEIRTCLFRVTRELLTNVVKHARARKIRAAVRKGDGGICVTIQDDGVGFEVARAGSDGCGASRFGLFSVREQLEHLGGRLEIESGRRSGTKAAVFLPFQNKSYVRTSEGTIQSRIQ